MSPLHVEEFNPSRKEWVKINEVHPTDPPRSISDNKPDGTRDLYLFKCATDDSKSVIFKSRSSIDTELGRFRLVSTKSNLEVVKELTKGESFEMDVMPDKSPVSQRFRFTHK